MKDKDFNEALSRQEIMEVVKRDMGSHQVKLIDYLVEAFSDNPMGFLGIHIKIRATVEVAGELKQRHYFAKKIPEDIQPHNAYAKGTRAFFKEIEFYKTVVQDIKQNSTPGRQLTKWCPEFYFARGIDILVEEDLCSQGFYMYPERTLFDMEHIMAAVKAMAAMHVGSMVVEQMMRGGTARHPPKGWVLGQPTDLAHLYSQIVYESECSDEPGHPGNTFYEAGFRSQPAIVDLLPNYSAEQKARIRNKLPDILRRIFIFVKPSDKFRNTWAHGDLWANNVMFHNDSDKGVEAVIIDFQQARLVPPAHDVIMFIHRVQSRDFRIKHQGEILDAYYTAFTKEAQAEGYDVNTILPRSEFNESCAFYYEWALISQIMVFQFILAPSPVTSKYLASPELFDLTFLTDRTGMVVEAFKTDDQCRQRVTEAMDELIQFYKLAD